MPAHEPPAEPGAEPRNARRTRSAAGSAGSAMAGLLQLADHFKQGETVVVIFHDHGTRYLGKMYNPDWMREKGFVDRKGLTARDLVADRMKAPLVTIDRSDTVEKAAHILTENAYSQIPVTADGRLVADLHGASPAPGISGVHRASGVERQATL